MEPARLWPVWPRITRAPRSNSESKVAASRQGRTPPTIRIAAVSTPAPAGMAKLRFRLSHEVLRQASSGPRPVSSSRKSAIGTFTRLKNGGPTVTFSPWTASESNGNSVPHRTAKHDARKTRLLNKKLDSRESSDSSLFSLLRCERFLTKKNTHTTIVAMSSPPNHQPIEDCANACTELTTPLRVRNVPRIDSMKVTKMSHTFQTFIMPRFSCIITEWRNAVAVSHGISEAFSTGSQPQYPPHPNTEYAQCAPRKMPQVRKSQVTMVQRRVM